ncbi:predicted protein [Plenodomus lingam JN3]|uniref:Uncharacterized protein n=1 Tax=Leptosphaeria maculans (strain JN3 / isolate v23.1.3 / race Av1-4-5-6-7-8) TaxID=985895 RepID=E5A655_LEPMJ|nr:predicted protein [Plenodomus lingam JN3]CBX99100.1 predicted protein [Plenodomus lingam JN3]
MQENKTKPAEETKQPEPTGVGKREKGYGYRKHPIPKTSRGYSDTVLLLFVAVCHRHCCHCYQRQ